MPQNPFPVEANDLLYAEKAVRAAMATLRRLPRGRNSRPATHLTVIWPEFANLTRHDDSPPRHRPIAPTPREIDFMDQVLVALLPLSTDQRRVLAARGCGASFRRLAAHFGLSHTTLRRRHRHALAALVTHLRHPDLPEGMDW